MSVQPGDIYQRPSRDEIAARVNGVQPPAARNGDDLGDVVTRREPEPKGSAVANFAVHLSARMRALGWTEGALAANSGFSKIAVGRALNGTSVGLEVAEKLADAVGGYLAAMIGPYSCRTCAGSPPKGYACLECGAETRAA